MTTFSFDPTTGTLRSDAVDERPDQVCPHLTPGLAHLLTQGFHVTAVYRTGWSKIDLDISLNDGPDPESLPDHVAHGAGAATWSNTDGHYPIAHGLVCAKCRQALNWPMEVPDGAQ